VLGTRSWRRRRAIGCREIIAKLATVFEVEPAELIRLPGRKPPPRV